MRLNESIEKERATAAAGALTREELVNRADNIRKEITKVDGDLTKATGKDERSHLESMKAALRSQLERMYEQMRTAK